MFSSRAKGLMFIWHYKAMQSTLCYFLQNSVIVHTFLADPQSLCVTAFLWNNSPLKKHRLYTLSAPLYRH